MTKEVLQVKRLLSQDNVKQRFTDMLGKKAQGFLVSVMNCVNNCKELQNADPQSVLMAAATAATLDLPIDQNLGRAYIIPYNQSYKDDKGKWQKKKVAQFQIGYKGFIELAQRTGQFRYIHATDVRKGEMTNNNRLTGELQFEWVQDEDERKKLDIVGYVSSFGLINGFTSNLYMTKKGVDAHAKKYSQSFKNNSGVWADDYESMAKKTVTKLNLNKNAPLSIQMQTAIQADQAVITEDAEYSYVDNKELPRDPHEMAILKEEKRTIEYINSCDTLEKLEQAQNHLTTDNAMKAYAEKHELLTNQNKQSK